MARQGEGGEVLRGDREGPGELCEGGLFRGLQEGRSPELGPGLGDIPGVPGVTVVPVSPELLLLLLPGIDGDDMLTGLRALREPSLLMTTSELSISSMLCPERMLPSRSGTGAASSGWGRLMPRLERPAVIGRATGW